MQTADSLLNGIDAIVEGSHVVLEQIFKVARIAAYNDHDVPTLFFDVVDMKGPAGLDELDFIVGLPIEHDGLIATLIGLYATILVSMKSSNLG